MTTQILSNRNQTIDVAKGIGIILVVLGHNWITQVNGDLNKLVFSFHMPLFFFLSGIFIRDSDRLTTFAASRADSLLKPYFAVLIVLGASKLLRASLTGTAPVPDSNYFFGIVYGTGSTIDWVPMWFLPHLFISSVFSFSLLKAIKNKTSQSASIALTAVVSLAAGIYFIDEFWHVKLIGHGFMGMNQLPGLPWSLDIIPVSSAFLLFGSLCRKHIQSMRFNMVAFFVITIAFCCLHFYFDVAMDLNNRFYGNPIISSLQAATGIYISLSLASFLQKFSTIRTSLAFIGSRALFILIFHSAFQTKAFTALSEISGANNFNGLLSLASGVGFPLLLWEITSRQRLFAALLLPQKSNNFRAKPAIVTG
jgi:fucose 4-O-acetylase-like acetyltransferase